MRPSSPFRGTRSRSIAPGAASSSPPTRNDCSTAGGPPSGSSLAGRSLHHVLAAVQLGDRLVGLGERGTGRHRVVVAPRRGGAPHLVRLAPQAGWRPAGP